MKEIKLTQGKVALVDDDDFEWLSKRRWFYKQGYAGRKSSGPKRKVILMHREIIKTPVGMDTDHVNRNGLDNRKSNLRVCNRSQNIANTGNRSTNTSGYKGVYWKKQNRKWCAEISGIKGKKTYLGLFENIVDAGNAYDQAAKTQFGEFAITNSAIREMRRSNLTVTQPKLI